jgi:hypothetical protein
MKVKVKDLKENPANPRVIKDFQFKKLVQSIKDFPEMLQVRKIVCTPDLVVLGGNMRLKALQMAGVKDVEVEIVDWDENKQRQFVVKDNLSYGEWDWEMLANEWEPDQLDAWGLDIPNFQLEDELELSDKQKKTLEEKFDTYVNASIKQIVLYYEFQEYEEIIKKLNAIAETEKLDDNSSVVQFLADNYLHEK